LFNSADISSMMFDFVMLLVLQLDCYYFWWCECSDNIPQLTTKVFDSIFLTRVKK